MGPEHAGDDGVGRRELELRDDWHDLGGESGDSMDSEWVQVGAGGLQAPAEMAGPIEEGQPIVPLPHEAVPMPAQRRDLLPVPSCDLAQELAPPPHGAVVLPLVREGVDAAAALDANLKQNFSSDDEGSCYGTDEEDPNWDGDRRTIDELPRDDGSSDDWTGDEEEEVAPEWGTGGAKTDSDDSSAVPAPKNDPERWSSHTQASMEGVLSCDDVSETCEALFSAPWPHVPCSDVATWGSLFDSSGRIESSSDSSESGVGRGILVENGFDADDELSMLDSREDEAALFDADDELSMLDSREDEAALAQKALRNFEDFYKIPPGTATLDQVGQSSAGVAGWAGADAVAGGGRAANLAVQTKRGHSATGSSVPAKRACVSSVAAAFAAPVVTEPQAVPDQGKTSPVPSGSIQGDGCRRRHAAAETTADLVARGCRKSLRGFEEFQQLLVSVRFAHTPPPAAPQPMRPDVSHTTTVFAMHSWTTLLYSSSAHKFWSRPSGSFGSRRSNVEGRVRKTSG